MRRTTIRPAARSDLRQARRWYDQQRDDLGAEFLARVEQAIGRLKQARDFGPLYYGPFHRYLVSRFPYKIFFHVRGNDVIIFRVLHTARDHKKLLPKSAN